MADESTGVVESPAGSGPAFQWSSATSSQTASERRSRTSDTPGAAQQPKTDDQRQRAAPAKHDRRFEHLPGGQPIPQQPRMEHGQRRSPR
jgi:hypothetical protein